MKQRIFLLAAIATLGVVSGDRDQSIGAESSQTSPAMSVFVSSAKSKTANLGGLRGADSICQELVSAVGVGNRTWRAYLSAERDPDNGNSPTDARSRIGTGPWSNAKGVVIAKSCRAPRPQRGRRRVSRRARPKGSW